MAPESSLAASARSATASAASAAAPPVDIHHQAYGFQLECEVEPDRAQELHRSGQKRTRGPVVEAVARTPAGSGEPSRSPFRKVGIGLSELGLVAGGLLEVVAGDLVALYEAVLVLVEPGGEAGVEISPDRLRKRVVGSVADQQVTEAIAVISGKQGAVGTDELAPHECGEPGRDLGLLGSECLHAATMEDLAFDRAALEHPTLGLFELVEASRQ